MKKLLLIHGWDYDNYYGRIDKQAWHNRRKFINELKKHYTVKSPDLPGFGLQKEPNIKTYTIDDFADYIHDYIVKNDYYPDYILGYSFGGAIAVTYLKKYGNVKLILVSPALIRNHYNSKNFIKTPKVLSPIRNCIRNFYLIHKIKVPEMVYGTKFLRNTYQSIVRMELVDTLKDFDVKDYIIIYGENDNMVNPDKMLTMVDSNIKNRIRFVAGGGHDIANTHTKELVNIINDFIK